VDKTSEVSGETLTITRPRPGPTKASGRRIARTRSPNLDPAAWAVGALESDRYRRVDQKSMEEEPVKFAKTMGVFDNPIAYPMFRPGEFDGKTPAEKARVVIDMVKSNSPLRQCR
jgi:hypothetical protein